MMHTANSMAKDLMFKLRLDEADRKRLEILSEHFSAPAATVVRMLVKREADAVSKPRVWQESLAFEDPDLWRRVVNAYVARFGEFAAQPSRDDSTLDATGNIVLRNTNGELARYRVREGRLYFVPVKGR